MGFFFLALCLKHLLVWLKEWAGSAIVHTSNKAFYLEMKRDKCLVTWTMRGFMSFVLAFVVVDKLL